MAIKTATDEQYSKAIRSLFPKGDYWEKQFSDNKSDVSLFCSAKTQEIIKLRHKMDSLFYESDYKTAAQTIDDWERIYLGYINSQLPLEERKKVLDARQTQMINRTIIDGIAKQHGLELFDIIFPFKSSFFGFSEFGISTFSRPAFYSVFYIISSIQDNELREQAQNKINEIDVDNLNGLESEFINFSYFTNKTVEIESLYKFEQHIKSMLISSNIVYFLYKL